MVKGIQRLVCGAAYDIYSLDILKNPNIEPQSGSFLWYFRLGQKTHNRLVRILCLWKLRGLRLKYGLEIGLKTNIGKGLYLGHAFNITINPDAVIGSNVSIHKGVLIGGGQ